MPENRGGSGRFKPGQSGNPGGRPKGLAAHVRTLVGADGDKLAEFMWGVLCDPVEDVKARMDACRWLADRGFGRVPQTVEMTGDEERPIFFEISAAKLAKAKEILDDATASTDQVHPA